jgi:flavodoxin
MRYEIAYISQTGNTKKLAYGIAEKLSGEDVVLKDLSKDEISTDSDIYLFGLGVNKGTVPLAIMDALEDLEGKKVMFFVTSGMKPTEEYKKAFENKLIPFISDDSDYRGLFMCYGRIHEKFIQKAQNLLYEDSENKAAKIIMSEAENAAEHPNKTDIDNAVRFIKEHLSDC